ncbi:TonB-dependent siderophore receptor [Novosphingobium sp. FSW06-99]|uniref:TonB-dependent receptor plug domain-containing protein n=1 Tax=Novosphingobium sp. FSW06-99 TaxID=1739113 RepID=UPI00076BFC8E|nr:TonB-dependent receptor [Novosphingobium sp. FSW06-99]KUR79762.1 TonB-dependent receptor [Novosphingobium sp. FSW06-99]
MPVLLILSAALANAPAPDTADAPPIVVTGQPLGDLPTASAYEVSTIDAARIEQVPSGRIEDALGDVAGVQLYRRSDSRASNPSADGFTLRGLGGNAASRTLVLLDGIPQADPFFGSVPLTALNPGDIADIRVIHGGGSGAFGSGAVAGTIDMTSAGPDQRGLVSGESLVDNRGDTTVSAGVAPHLGDGFVVVSGRWDRGPGFWTTPVNERVAASAKARYESWDLALRAVTQVAPDIELQSRLAAFGDDQTLRFVGANTGMSGEDASLRLVGRGAWQFDALVYGQVRNFNSLTLSSTTYLPVDNQRDTPSTGVGGKIEVRPPVGHGQVLRLGADLRDVTGYEDEDSYTKGVISGHHREGGSNDDLGIYGEDAWTLGALQLTAGARADHWVIRDGQYQSWTLGWSPILDTHYADRSGWNGSFRGGALLHATGALDLRGSAYSGMRQPTLNELYRTYTVFPVTTAANPNLVNEQVRGFEGGVDWRPVKGLKLTVTGFDNKVDHAIANITLTATTQVRENVPAIHARGVEAGAQAQLGTLALGGSLEWVHSRMEAPGQNFDGLVPPQTPRLSLSANAAWTPRAGTTLGVTLRHVGTAYEDSLETAPLPGATTFGAYATTPLVGRFSLVLRGENLGNATVVTRNSGGTIDIGTPRTVWAGVRVGL